MLISKTEWSQQRLSPLCNLMTPTKGLPTPLSMDHSRPCFKTQPKRHLLQEAFLDIPRYLRVLPSGSPKTGVHTSTTVILVRCNWEPSSHLSLRRLLLDLNICFLPSRNFRYPLNGVSITSSAFLQGPTLLGEWAHGERSLSPKTKKRTIFLEGRDHGSTIFVSFSHSSPVSTIHWLLNKYLSHHLTGEQGSGKQRHQKSAGCTEETSAWQQNIQIHQG